MIIDFQQGVVSYPASLGQQTFLTYSGGYVSLTPVNGQVSVTFAHGPKNYLHVEANSVQNAWGPFNLTTQYWLYWDINSRTGLRTFGSTTVQPTFGPYKPTSPVQNQHWFNTTEKKMYVYDHGYFRETIRVFAAKLLAAVFTPLGTVGSQRPYAGTQVGLATPRVEAGRLVFDSNGDPIRRSTGEFFTTEDQVFVSGSNVNVIKIESTVSIATAAHPIAKFQVAKLVGFGRLELASYNDAGATSIVMVTEDLNTEQTGAYCVQGMVTNPTWNWTTVGAPLWISGTQPGVLVDVDPHLTNPVGYPTSRVPVARVFSATEVYFDQGLGGKGDKGNKGDPDEFDIATTAVLGAVRLSVDAIDPVSPIVVGSNDPRLNNKVLKAGDAMSGFLVLHSNPIINMHAATKQYVDTAVAGVTPDISGLVRKIGDSMSGYLVLHADPVLDMQATTKQYVDNAVATVSIDPLSFVRRVGDSMLGFLTLHSLPTQPAHAATKQYVDNRVASVTVDTSNFVLRTGSTMTGFLALHANPTANMHAATKQYVDTALTGLDAYVAKSGSTMTGPLTLNANPVNNLHAATKLYVDTAVSGATVDTSTLVLKAGSTMTGPLTLNANPVNNLHAATKQYVDAVTTGMTAYVARSGNAAAIMTGYLTLNANPINNLHAATKLYVDTAIAAVDVDPATLVLRTGSTMTGHLLLNADPTANLHAATKQYVDTSSAQVSTNAVLKTGGVMTGSLTLNANPTNNLHAATKQYVDTADALSVLKTGGTMTGLLTLSGAPTANLHAATKQYVDAAVSATGVPSTVQYDIPFFFPTAGGSPARAYCAVRLARAVTIAPSTLHVAWADTPATTTYYLTIGAIRIATGATPSIGSIEFSAGSKIGVVTLTATTDLAVGDVITIRGQTTTTTLRDVCVTVVGTTAFGV